MLISPFKNPLMYKKLTSFLIKNINKAIFLKSGIDSNNSLKY